MFDFSKSRPFFTRMFTILERHIKVPIFDCSMCGQCIVRSTGMICPMQCPKQMRNGPCGGAMNGECEVFPDRACVWHRAYEKMEKKGKQHDLETIQPAVDWRLWGTSAWLNLARKQIDASGHAHSEEVTEHWR